MREQGLLLRCRGFRPICPNSHLENLTVQLLQRQYTLHIQRLEQMALAILLSSINQETGLVPLSFIANLDMGVRYPRPIAVQLVASLFFTNMNAHTKGDRPSALFNITLPPFLPGNYFTLLRVCDAQTFAPSHHVRFLQFI